MYNNISFFESTDSRNKSCAVIIFAIFSEMSGRVIVILLSAGFGKMVASKM